jgi:lipoprotein-releasing system ATP-binding protein
VADEPRTETLRLAGVRKSYGAGTPVEVEVLHGIDLSLQEGEFAALIGPSGSGKTTLLNLIGLLDSPSAGQLFIAGREASALGEMEATRLRGRAIGFIFQYHYLLPAFTALENVMMPMLAARGRADAQMREAAARLLARVGLTPWCNHKASDISGGQQQRVAIARALAMTPVLVLADEPSGNLDTENADAVFDLMRDVNETSSTTFLIVTHDPRLARRCDRIIELVDGRVVSDEPNSDVVRRGESASISARTASPTPR